MSAWPGIIERYREFLPVSAKTPVITLLEGNTPLVPAPRLAEATDPSLKVYLKCEGFNPTGSFKDRGMTMAMSKALEAGSRAVICASTGNTSASAAAFAARAGINAFVMVPRGGVALGKLSQAAIHGARVLMVEGSFDQALAIVMQIAERYPVTLVNSINPFRLEGQKTGAFEVVDQLGRAPDYHLIPVGNAGNITAYWRGYKEYQGAGHAKELPRMVGFQAAGAAPIYENRIIPEPRTVATAIKIGNPASWGPAVEAMKDSQGWIDIVTDEEILHAYRLLAREEGIFMEPASAASVAGLIKTVKSGRVERGSTLVLTLTGHGLKDPDTALESASRPTTVPAELGAVLAQLGF
ncbi:MAG: threonine synthase [Candidatus Rokuibacteriota bacterium]|nr:MAG: threonine synthase [Candidatus Rokubacteria bacterium]